MKTVFGPLRPRTLVLTLLLGATFGLAAGGVFALTRDLPQILALADFHPAAVTRVYSADGVLLTELFVQRRDPVPLAEVPVDLKAAVLATEDREFYSHGGVVLRSILRAILRDLRAGAFVEGASTITQQLAKTLFLTPQKNLMRKLREAVLAVQLERRYTKDEILALYLNQIYLGSGAYGVAAAAATYFDKPLGRLSLAEAALIAGLPKAPSRFSPRIDPQRALQRRNTVLQQMRDIGCISDGQYRSAVAEPLQLAPPKRQTEDAALFVDTVRRVLEEKLGADLVYKGGLTVHTTLDYRLQRIAVKSVRSGVDRLTRRMARQNPEAPKPEAALVALDVRSGAVLAMVGGRREAPGDFNRATMALRQPGSAFKPILYALAVEKGFGQNALLLDAPAVWDGAGNQDWQPRNYSGTYAGEITLRKALTHSKNLPAVRLIERLGPEGVAAFAGRMGISTPLAPTLSLALGASAVRLIDLTAAYAVFPNQGRHVRPYTVTEVADAGGRLLWHRAPVPTVAMSPEGASVMVDMLQGVIREGTGRGAGVIRHPVGGKTGTTDLCRDALFVGFSPSVAAGVWVGRDDNQSLGAKETGARAALPLWTQFMEEALALGPYEYFPIPDGLQRVWMDPDNGRLAAQKAPGLVGCLVQTAPPEEVLP